MKSALSAAVDWWDLAQHMLCSAAKTVREIALLDLNANLAEGHALDLLHGTPSVADQVISFGSYEHVPTSDVICITAGLRRKPDESRLDLINRNTDLFVSILDEIKKVGFKEKCDRPRCLQPRRHPDLRCCKTTWPSRYPSHRTGNPTRYDPFRSLIANKLKAPPTQTNALILGEHGDSMVPIWSSATIGGLSLEKYPGWDSNTAAEIFKRTKVPAPNASLRKAVPASL